MNCWFFGHHEAGFLLAVFSACSRPVVLLPARVGVQTSRRVRRPAVCSVHALICTLSASSTQRREEREKSKRGEHSTQLPRGQFIPDARYLTLQLIFRCYFSHPCEHCCKSWACHMVTCHCPNVSAGNVTVAWRTKRITNNDCRWCME